ncbi:MAG: DUF308 domain-containing protein [Clostridia bacterium]|nr:DUF308 domain-containing protein [Clostridia bacterium]
MEKNTLPLIVIGILGVLLILWPGTTLNLVCKLAGIALLLVGASSLYQWWQDKDRKAASAAQVIGSVVALALGLWILLHTRAFESLIQFVLGIVMIAYGALELYRAVKDGQGTVLKVLPIVALVLGLIICFKPFGSNIRMFSVFAGIALIYTSVTGLLGERK